MCRPYDLKELEDRNYSHIRYRQACCLGTAALLAAAGVGFLVAAEARMATVWSAGLACLLAAVAATCTAVVVEAIGRLITVAAHQAGAASTEEHAATTTAAALADEIRSRREGRG